MFIRIKEIVNGVLVYIKKEKIVRIVSQSEYHMRHTFEHVAILVVDYRFMVTKNPLQSSGLATYRVLCV